MGQDQVTFTTCECEKCGGRLEFDSDHIGTVTQCPLCQANTTLGNPHPSAHIPQRAAPISPPSSLISCPDCGRQVSKRAAACPQCGAPFQTAQQPPIQTPPPTAPQAVYTVPVKSRGAFILLGFFFGLLGLHNFYAGFIIKGVIQLLITVLLGWLIIPLVFVGFWVIMELITVDYDAYDMPMR